MRVAAIVLVVLGAVVLGAHSFGPLSQDQIPLAGAGGGRDGPAPTAWAIPVVGGIAVVGGLLLLVGDTRRE